MWYKIIGGYIKFKCTKCKKEIEDNGTFCIYCGEKFKKKCSNCNSPVKEDYQYCKNCGAKLIWNESKSNKIVRRPGEILSKVAFWLVVSNIIVWIISLILQISLPLPYFMLAGLICGIVGITQSKKSGKVNRLAIIATIVSSIIFFIAIIVGLYNLVQY